MIYIYIYIEPNITNSVFQYVQLGVSSNQSLVNSVGRFDENINHKSEKSYLTSPCNLYVYAHMIKAQI